MGANQPARNPAKCLASCPRHFPATAGQWPQQCRRVAVETTRNLAAQQRRNNLQAARGNFAVSF